MNMRKCCRTPKGRGPHEARCENCRAPANCSRLPRLPREARLELLEDIASDMPDGAYLAIAHDLGIDMSDL